MAELNGITEGERALITNALNCYRDQLTVDEREARELIAGVGTSNPDYAASLLRLAEAYSSTNRRVNVLMRKLEN